MSQSTTHEDGHGLQPSEWFEHFGAARRAFHDAVEAGDTQEASAPYIILCLNERYEWACRLLCIVSDLNLDHDVFPPAVLRAWNDASVQLNGDEHVEPTQLGRRVAIIQMLGQLAEVPGICQGLAAAMRRMLIEYDREAWEAI
jgi:hypothetical protein